MKITRIAFLFTIQNELNGFILAYGKLNVSFRSVYIYVKIVILFSLNVIV